MRKKLTLAALGLSLGLIGCGSKDNNNAQNHVPMQTPMQMQNNQYVMNGSGQCISQATGQMAPTPSYCQGGAGYNQGYNSGYVMTNGQCMSTTTGQMAPINYCTNTQGYTGGGYAGGGYAGAGGYVGGGYAGGAGGYIGGGVGGYIGGGMGGMTQPCYGMYISMSSGSPVQGQCYGSNCSGYQLVSVSTGQTVICQ